MVRLSRLVVLSVTLSSVSLAKPWNGIAPGASSRLDVIAKFGDPSKVLSTGGRDTLVYLGPRAIRGTVQAQFKLGADGAVARIDVYPSVSLTAEAIAETYGPACASDPTEPCFVAKETPQQRTYWVYAKLGLAVFFGGDGRTVQSLAFLPGAAAPR